MERFLKAQYVGNLYSSTYLLSVGFCLIILLSH